MSLLGLHVYICSQESCVRRSEVLVQSQGGRFVDVDSLDVSSNVQQLLKEVDAEGTMTIYHRLTKKHSNL